MKLMGAKRILGRGARAALLSILLIILLTPSISGADVLIGTPGSGKGQIERPRGLAVDASAPHLFVSDSGNSRIDVFDADSGEFVRAFGWGVADGTSNELQVCTTTCFKGLPGSGAGQFLSMEGVAVDDDSTSPAYHDVYVFDNGNHRVQRFTPQGEFVWMVGGGVNQTTGANLCTASSGDVCGAGTAGDAAGHINDIVSGGVAVGPGGVVYVADQIGEIPNRKIRVQKYEPSGAPAGSLILTVSGGVGRVTGLAVDSGGNIYVSTNNETGAVRKFSPAGVELFSLNPSFNNTAIAIDSADRLFVADPTAETPSSPVISKIFEYSATGSPLRTFYGSFERTLTGLAPYSNSNGNIFTAELEASGSSESSVRHVVFPPPGPVVYPREVVATGVGNKKATLKAKINPEGEATTYHFEYITDADFKAAGETFGTGTISTTETSLGFEDFIQHPVEASVTGIFPETIYHFRVVAKNTSGEDKGPVATFTTKEPLEFGEVWSMDIGTKSATLAGEVNPLGIPATARFEYVELAKWEASGYAEAIQVPGDTEDPIDLGEGEEVKKVSASLADLQEGSSYRYRITAASRCKPEPAPFCDFEGPEGTFTTFVAIDPIEDCPNGALRAAGSGSFLPDCRAYEMVSPVDKNGAFIETAFNINGFPASLNQAAVNGDSITYSAHKAFGKVDSAPYTNQYLARRSSTGWQSEGISPKREGPSLMMYLSAALDRQYKAFSDDLCGGWVVQDAKPILAPGGIDGYPGLYRRDNCGLEAGAYEALTTLEPPAPEPPNLPPRKFIPELQGISADGSVGVFSVDDNLTSDAPTQPQACVEETNPSDQPCLPHVYEAREGQLNYVCILPNGTPHGGPCAAGTSGGKGGAERSGTMTHAVSDDASHIFWTASAEGPGKLYVRIDGSEPSAETIEISPSPLAQFWLAAADGSVAVYSVGEKLFEYDVEAEVGTEIAEGFKGVAGASEDASRIYFASTKVLTGEEVNSEGDKAEAGKPNLYLYEAGSGFKFVGALTSLEGLPGEPSAVSKFPIRRLSRVTPDGEQIVFMSRASLTGYDNLDAVTKKQAMEIFLFNTPSGELLCPSCNPSGARPEGRALTQKGSEGLWGAARIPTFQSQLYGARVISDDGTRLYFNSFESLVSIDTNNEEDVYQWQALGAGECTSESQTYHGVSGGCLDLISSGKSPQGAELVDISASGRDVFFKTSESLVSQDPGLRDVYDARMEGGFPPLPPPPLTCLGEACREPINPAPIEPAAAQMQGPPNPTWPKPKPKPRKCPKGKHRVKGKGGKTRCVKNKPSKGKAGKRGAKNRGAAQ